MKRAVEMLAMAYYFGPVAILISITQCQLPSFLQDFIFLLYTCLKNRQKLQIKKKLPKTDELLQEAQ